MPPPSLPHRLRAAVSVLLLWTGAACVLGGSVAAWVIVTVFRRVEMGVPGLFFYAGALCLSVAILILLRGTRAPLLCLIGAIFVLTWTHRAGTDTLLQVRRKVTGTAVALSPVNRLLDKFSVPEIEIADPFDRSVVQPGPGLAWTTRGGWLLLLGGALGLPGDPLALWFWRRTARRRCRTCGARWPVSRPAAFCPACGGSALPPGVRLCPVCRTESAPSDRHCIACGAGLECSKTA